MPPSGVLHFSSNRDDFEDEVVNLITEHGGAFFDGTVQDTHQLAVFRTNSEVTVTLTSPEESSTHVLLLMRYDAPPVLSMAYTFHPSAAAASSSSSGDGCGVNLTLTTLSIVTDARLDLEGHSAKVVWKPNAKEYVRGNETAAGVESQGEREYPLREGRLFFLIVPGEGHHLGQLRDGGGSLRTVSLLRTAYRLDVRVHDSTGVLLETVVIILAGIAAASVMACFRLAPRTWTRINQALWQSIDEHQAADTKALLLHVEETREREVREAERVAMYSNKRQADAFRVMRTRARSLPIRSVSGRPMVTACMWALHTDIFRKRKDHASRGHSRHSHKYAGVDLAHARVSLTKVQNFADLFESLARIARELKMEKIDFNKLVVSHWGAFDFMPVSVENFSATVHGPMASRGEGSDNDDLEGPLTLPDLPGLFEEDHVYKAVQLAHQSYQKIANLHASYSLGVRTQGVQDVAASTRELLHVTGAYMMASVLPIKHAFDTFINDASALNKESSGAQRFVIEERLMTDMAAVAHLIAKTGDLVTFTLASLHDAFKKVNIAALLTPDEVHGLVRRYLRILQHVSALVEVILKGVDGVGVGVPTLPVRQRVVGGAFGEAAGEYMDATYGGVAVLEPIAAPAVAEAHTLDRSASGTSMPRVQPWLLKVEQIVAKVFQSELSTGMQYQGSLHSRQGSLKQLVLSLHQAVATIEERFPETISLYETYLEGAPSTGFANTVRHKNFAIKLCEQFYILRNAVLGGSTVVLTAVTDLAREIRAIVNDVPRLYNDPSLAVVIMFRSQALEELLKLMETLRSSLGNWFLTFRMLTRNHINTHVGSHRFQLMHTMPEAFGQPVVVVLRRALWLLEPSHSLLKRFYHVKSAQLWNLISLIQGRLQKIPLPRVDCAEVLDAFQAELRAAPPQPRLDKYLHGTLLSVKRARNTGSLRDICSLQDRPLAMSPSARRLESVRLSELLGYVNSSSTRLPNPTLHVMATESSVRSSNVPSWAEHSLLLLLPPLYAAALLLRIVETVAIVIRLVFNLALMQRAISVVFPSRDEDSSFRRIMGHVGANLHTENMAVLIADINSFFRKRLDDLDLFSAVDESNYNCGGLVFMAIPLSLAFGVFLLLFVIRRDALIYVGVNLKNRAFNYSQPYRTFLYRMADACTIFFLYLLQIVIVSMLGLTTSNIAHFRRTCSELDYVIGIWLGPVVMYSVLVLLLVFFFHTFSGAPTSDPDLPRPLWLMYQFLSGLLRMVAMLFGVWTSTLLTSHRIFGRAAVNNTNPEEKNSQQEEVLRLLAKTNGLFYLLIPLGIFATKLQEAMNTGVIFIHYSVPLDCGEDCCPLLPPALKGRRTAVRHYDHTGGDLHTPFHKRLFIWCFSVSKYVLSVATLAYLDTPVFIYIIGAVLAAESVTLYLYDCYDGTRSLLNVRSYGNLNPL